MKTHQVIGVTVHSAWFGFMLPNKLGVFWCFGRFFEHNRQVVANGVLPSPMYSFRGFPGAGSEAQNLVFFFVLAPAAISFGLPR